MKKFAFIGGESFGFTRTLVKDLLTFSAFRDAKIALMDIDEERLEYIKLACEKIVRAGNTLQRLQRQPTEQKRSREQMVFSVRYLRVMLRFGSMIFLSPKSTAFI